MWALLTKIWDGLQWLVGLVLPVFARASDFRRIGPALRWALHVLLVIAILVGLYFLNKAYGLVPTTWVPSSIAFLRDSWLPILFLMIYVLGWLGWCLWRLLGAEEEVSDFPDIDAAWDEAMLALRREGIYLPDVPVFLVLGQPAGGEQALFEAAKIDFTVKGVPVRADAPLRVYGNPDSVFVTCAGTSVLSRLADVVSHGAAGGDSSDENGEGAEAIDPTKTLMPGKGRPAQVKKILARAEQEGRAPTQLTEEEQDQLERLVKAERRSTVAQVERRPRTTILMKNMVEVEEMSARVRHLCRLLVRQRRPYCPLNGILLLIPLASTDTDRDAQDAGLLCRVELAHVRAVLRQDCPLFALVCDLERVPGFTDFIKRFSEEDRLRRLGQRFPLGPDLEAAEMTAADMIESGTHWICHTVFPTWIYDLFRLDKAGRDNLADVVRGNTQLYWLLCEMHERQRRLSRVLTQTAVTESGSALWMGGCYLAGTGKNAAREQAFVAGVFRRLLEEQSVVAWTDEALAEDARWRNWARIGSIVIGVTAAVVAGLGAWWLFKK